MKVQILILCCFSLNILATKANPVHREVKASDIIYTLYTINDTNGVNVTLDNIEILNSTSFDGSLKYTFIIVFGVDDARGSDTYKIKDSLFEKYNVFVVNWKKLADSNGSLEDKVVALGDYMAQFFSKVDETYYLFFIKTHFIAFSVAAHAAGITASKLNTKISSLEALDPAIIDPNNPTKYLNTSVTHYLKITHTNGGKNGIFEHFGHIDYYPNGGINQAGCEDDACSHDRALAYFAESLKDNEFVAWKCTDYETYKGGYCYKGEWSYSLMGGVLPNRRTYGVYFLDTNSEPPYGQGSQD